MDPTSEQEKRQLNMRTDASRRKFIKGIGLVGGTVAAAAIATSMLPGAHGTPSAGQTAISTPFELEKPYDALFTDGTYGYTVNSDTGAVTKQSSSTTLGLQELLDLTTTNLYVFPGLYNMPSGFTTVTAFGGAENFYQTIMGYGAEIAVPNGFDSIAMIVGEGGGGINNNYIQGFQFLEQGTPIQDWTALRIRSTTAGNTALYVRDMLQYSPNIGTEFYLGSSNPDTAYLNSIEVSCICVYQPITAGFKWTADGANHTFDYNKYDNLSVEMGQGGAFTDCIAFDSIDGAGSVLEVGMGWDINGSQQIWTTSSALVGFLAVGGDVANGLYFTDNSGGLYSTLPASPYAAIFGSGVQFTKRAMTLIRPGLYSDASGNVIADAPTGANILLRVNGSNVAEANASTLLTSVPLNIGPTFETNYEIWDATQGSGSATLYIGNSSINVTAPSLSKYKYRINPSKVNAVDLLRRLKIYDFNYRQGKVKIKGRQTGFLADEVAKSFPGLVEDGEHVQAHRLIPHLIKAVQEQADKIERLEAKVSSRGKKRA